MFFFVFTCYYNNDPDQYTAAVNKIIEPIVYSEISKYFRFKEETLKIECGHWDTRSLNPGVGVIFGPCLLHPICYYCS